METPIAEPVAEVQSEAQADPFAIDDSALAILTPEQKASLTPVLDGWKKRASEEISKREKSYEEKASKTYEEKYKPDLEKARALEGLVQDPRFQQWYANMQAAGVQQNPQNRGAISQAQPQDFATPQEWQEAVLNASNGDSAKLREIQSKMFTSMAAPVVQGLQQSQQQLQQGYQELQTERAMENLFKAHPDALELDKIGRPEGDNKTPSLLEVAMHHVVDVQKGSIEDGYALARRWADSLGKTAQQQAMGLVQEKKQSVTAGPSTANAGQQVVEVASTDELLTKNMEALMAGLKPPRYVVKK